MRSLAIGAIVAGLAAPPLSAQPLEERLPTCLSCHGETGTSQEPETPSLGAQRAFYATVQLFMFRDKLRVSERMNETTEGKVSLQFLSPAQLCRTRERSQNRRPARGLPAQVVAYLQGQLAARLLRANVRGRLPDEGRGLRRSRLLPCAAEVTLGSLFQQGPRQRGESQSKTPGGR